MFLLSILFIHGLCIDYALSVVKNQPARLGEFPYHVSIQNADSSYHHCGGTIIHPYYVLTAAHCIYGFEADEFQIVCGTIDLSKKDQIIHEVIELIPHENYESNSWKNDIGLMIVDRPFDFNYVIKPAHLPQEHSNIVPGVKATVIGFGRTDPNGFTSKILREAEVVVKSISYCNEKYQKTEFHFGSNQICAQSIDGAGICKGDSGGAFIINKTVVGISSFTNDDCDHVKYPSVFTKIPKYMAWIDIQISKNLKSKL